MCSTCIGLPAVILASFIDTNAVSCLQGVGRRKVGPAQPFQYVQRPHRLGLGAEPAKPEVQFQVSGI